MKSIIFLITLLVSFSTYSQPKAQSFSVGLDYTFQKEPTQTIDDNEFIHHHLQGAKHSGFIPSITYHINEKQAIGGTIGFGFSNPEGEWIGSNSILKFNSQSYQLGIFYRHQYPIFDRLNVFIYPNLTSVRPKLSTQL